jgi:hypothetical protein
VLDIDPENAQAYLGKLMAELRVRKQEDLKNCEQPFDGNGNYQKTLRFADEGLKNTLLGYIEHINTRNENARLEGIYAQAQNVMATAKSERSFYDAARLFDSIPNYLDSASLAKECRNKAEVARKDAILVDGRIQANNSGNSISRLKDAIKTLQKVSGWKDADELLAKCQKKIEEIKAKAEADRLERERQAEIAGIANARKKKRNIIIGVSVSVLAVVIIITLILLDNYVWTPNQYRAAIELYEAGKYTDAVEEFSDLGTYEDSENWAKKSKYEYILSNKNNKDRTTYEYLKSLKVEGYKDCMSIYDELYAWNVEFVINKSETDTKNNTIYKVKPGDIFYVHVNVSGGYPGGHVYVTPQYRLPLSYFSWETLDNSGSYSDGESKCVWFKAGSEAHTLYLQAKIGDEVVASTSIEIDK